MHTNSDISCDVVMDLVAIYKDGLASDDTKTLVRAHLHTCPKCRQMYAGYRAADGARASACVPMPPKPDGGYSRLARHLYRQHMISTAAMIALMGVAAVFGAVETYRLCSAYRNTDDTAGCAR